MKPASANTQKLFQRLGLEKAQDFIVHLPLRYEDETRIQEIALLRSGLSAQVEGTILSAEVHYRPRRQMIVVIDDGTARLNLRWLNFYPGLQKQLTQGKKVRARGEVRPGHGGLEIIHPRITSTASPLAAALTPIYPTTQGLSQPSLRRAITLALQNADLSDTLPDTIRKRFELPDFSTSIRFLHHPPPDISQDDLHEREHPAWKRIKFDELLAQQLALATARAARYKQTAQALRYQAGDLPDQLREQLPFRLTQAQERVFDEIRQDLARPIPMHRLLQGDVGSGKTVIAALAAAQAIQNKVQAAIMAPTEILAEQHFSKMQGWFDPLGIRMAWLSGSQTARQRQEALDLIAAGTASLVIGTQALIQDKVQFARLGLIITDEQHRFGVGQRLDFGRKGEQQKGTSSLLPHQLSMSATPIPRTLAMSFFSDLDVSSIDELPPGRTPVITKLIGATRRAEVLSHVRRAVLEGRQAYWVCPLVEESEALQLQTAVDTFSALQQALPDLRVGLVHGKLKPAEKAQVMDAFRAGTIDLLVATTVIEVGVDVPNATLMVIEHAERFGLAQLHQLRGRVGRGAAQAFCVLLYQTPVSHVARQRLRAMYETTDGFVIARRDLEQRGPGEFLGLRQSGMAMLRFANIETDRLLLEQAQSLAQELLADHPDIAQAHMQRWMPGKTALLRS